MLRHVCDRVHRRHPDILENGPRTPRAPSKSPNYLKGEQVVCQILQIRILAMTGFVFGTRSVQRQNFSRSHQDRSRQEIEMSNYGHRDMKFLGIGSYYRRFVQDFA